MVLASGHALRNGLLTAALAAALLFAGPASAATTTTVNCAGLDAALATLQGGDTLILRSTDGTGVGPGGAKLCTGQHNLPNNPGGSDVSAITLKGDLTDPNADGFDGTGAGGRVLTGVNVHRFEVTDLIFRDSTQPAGNGGAISVTGDSGFAVRSSTFLNNHADSGSGGAVFVSPGPAASIQGTGISSNTFGSTTVPAEGNSAVAGGAVAVDTNLTNANSGSTSNLYANNVAKTTGGGLDWVVEGSPAAENVSLTGDTYTANKAGAGGGGAHVLVGSATALRVDQTRFEGNSVEPVTGSPALGDRFGGGLFIENGGSPQIQRNNVYENNEIKAFPSGNLFGGGEAIRQAAGAPNVTSQVEQWVGNKVAAADGADEAEGGGIAAVGDNLTFHAWLAVVAGNQVGAGGEGGGAYAGADVGSTTVEFADSTVAANSVGAGGSNAGLGGGGDDVLKLTNSIVSNPSTNPDIGGFTTLNISYSDACQAGGTAFPGTGNICANPLLKDPVNGDIHQTTTSPTIDKGNDALFEAEEESPCCDFEGDPRPVDGDGDGHTVDMGADESPAFVKPPTGTVVSAAAQCTDGKDNDSDGATDLKDPGCGSAADNNEGDESLNDLVLCGRRQISLVRADAKGKRVVLSGLVAAKFAGKAVTINANYGKKKLATVKAKSSGAFSVTVKGPSRRFFNKARFSANVDKFKSVALKLPQSLASSSVKLQGATIVLRGKVKRSLLGKRNAVVVRRIVCGRYTTVGQAKPNKNGTYVVRFSAPGLSTTALYRAETKVLAKPRGKRYVKQFARALGIALTGQTG